jgi:exopolysaccharide production protein ExoZ
MIWSLQILRFIAALMIVYVHAEDLALIATGSSGTIPHDLAIVGAAGVDIFFVLSGVVIAKTAPGMTSAQFALRRIRRILPIYLVACVPLLIGTTGLGWRDVVSTILLWPATDIMTAPVLPAAWTLSFEMLFYFCAALILHDRRWLYALGCLYGMALALRPLSPVFQFLGNPLAVEFLIGVVLAYAPPLPRVGVWLVPLGFAALAAVSGFLHMAPNGDCLTGQENLYRVFVYGLPSALIVYGFMQIRARKSVWTYLGDMSYSLYLFHPYSIALLRRSLMSIGPIQSDLIIIIAMAASVLFAWRIYVLIEMPILRAIPTQKPLRPPPVGGGISGACSLTGTSGERLEGNVAKKRCPFCRSTVAWDATACPRCARDIDTIEAIQARSRKSRIFMGTALAVGAIIFMIAKSSTPPDTPATAVVTTAAPAKPAVEDLSALTLRSAHAFCAGLKATGLLTDECKVSTWNQTVEATVDVTSTLASVFCTKSIEQLRGTKLKFEPGWHLKVFSPYSGHRATANCDLVVP